MTAHDLKELVAELQAVPEFADANPSVLERLATVAAPRIELANGEQLFSSGSYPQVVYVLLEGSIRLTGIDKSGQAIELEVREAPALVGEAAALDGGERMVNASAAGPAVAVSLPAAEWRNCIREDAALGLGLARRLAAVLRHQTRD
jgi:CRP-like cAMP-binding protein